MYTHHVLRSEFHGGGLISRHFSGRAAEAAARRYRGKTDCKCGCAVVVRQPRDSVRILARDARTAGCLEELCSVLSALYRLKGAGQSEADLLDEAGLDITCLPTWSESSKSTDGFFSWDAGSLLIASNSGGWTIIGRQ